MKKEDKNIIFGIDHGYGYIKTANTIMKSGIEEIPVKPPFHEDILEIDKRVYVAGQARNEHEADKTLTKDYYYLTMAALAKEMSFNHITEASNVIIAAGLPYSFFASQKKTFKEYLMQKKTIHFLYEGKKYHIELKDVNVYPQGLPVLARELDAYRNKTVSVVDIGSRTIDVITYLDGKPYYDMCYSVDKRGTLDCVESTVNYYLEKFHENIDEEEVQKLFQKENTTLSGKQNQFVKEIIKWYAKDIMKLLENKINGNIILCGGGASVIKNYYDVKRSNTRIIDDIYCNAKGYELLTYNRLKK